MALTYTDKGKKILHSWGRFRVTLAEAVETGDLLSFYNGDTSSTVQFADESSEQRAQCIACQDGAADDEIWACLKGEFKASETFSGRAVPSDVYFAESTDFLGSPLYLGEDGKAESTTGTTYRQVVGFLLARNRIILEIKPTQNDSDLYFASGAIVDFESADITITHTSGGKLGVAATWVTPAATGRPWESRLTTDVLLGDYANALKGYVDCNLTGGSVGLLSGVNGEIRLPNAASRGAYYGLESEVVFQTSSSINPDGSSAGFLYCGISGAGITEFDNDGVFMSVVGLTPLAGNLLSEDMHTMKCGTVVSGVVYDKFLVFSEQENGIYWTHTADTSGDLGIHVLNTFTLATAGSSKAIIGEVTYQPTAGGFGTPIGVVGKINFGEGISYTGGQGAAYGVQGQLNFMDTATIDQANVTFAGLRGVITHAGTPVFTDFGVIAGLYVDNLCTIDLAGISTYYTEFGSSLISLQNHGGTLDHGIVMRGGNKITDVFAFSSMGVAIDAGTKGGAATHMVITVDGTTKYINIYGG